MTLPMFVSLMTLTLHMSCSVRSFALQVTILSWSQHSKVLASGSLDRKICLWTPESEDPLKSWKLHSTLEGHDGRVSSLQYSSAGNSLLSGEHR